MHERGYFRWLCKTYLIDRQGNPDGYSILLEQLHRKAYYFTIDMDGNRAEDGLYLRTRYLEFLNGRPGSVPEGPCSFLEFLIGVSIRLEEMLYDGEDVPVSAYFWELASRLRLTEYTDDTYGEESTLFVVDAIMTDYMDRKYCRDGSGGLFPLRNHNGRRKDQRKIEVWYQLNAFLIENDSNFFSV